MGLTRHSFRTIAERRPAIVTPGHLEHSGIADQLSNPQRRTEGAIRYHQVWLEGLEHDSAKRGPLLPR
jgi:hypothetical protein